MCCKSATPVEHSAVNRVVARSSRAGGAKKASAVADAFYLIVRLGKCFIYTSEVRLVNIWSDGKMIVLFGSNDNFSVYC